MAPAMDDRIDWSQVRQALARLPRVDAVPEFDRTAAVAVILRERSRRTEVLLIRRATRAGDPWSGHMGLPGGHREAGDRDLLATALRETHEEIGLDLQRVAEPLGSLPAVQASARGQALSMQITPFVFGLVSTAEPRASNEVEEVLWAPIGPLARSENPTLIQVDHGGKMVELPGWDVSGRTVWGLTYQMLSTLFRAVRSTAP
jgi:8-oxo-dGTP pyrophosphatase MutT (NUDIX family)